MKNEVKLQGYCKRTLRLSFLSAVLLGCFSPAFAQPAISSDGKSYTRYSSSYFRPNRGLFYSIYLSPILTVDPLGLGGKSTYGLALGSRVRLWESKTPENLLTGLKIKSFYTAVTYEYYPQQYNKVCASLWVRIRAFIPLAGRFDYIYSYGYGLRGLGSRVCVGFEIKRVTIFVCAEGLYYHKLGSTHPQLESPYTNAGEIMAVIPVFTRKEK